MRITDLRIKLCQNERERLMGFCTLTFDNIFVVRDLKIIEGDSGVFIAMPSRKLTDACNHCSGRNHLRARFCNDCGGRLNSNRALQINGARSKLHIDVAHPISQQYREKLHQHVLKAYELELERSRLPHYDPEDFGADYPADGSFGGSIDGHSSRSEEA